MGIATLTMLLLLQQPPSADPNQFNDYLLLGYVAMWLIAMVYVGSLFVRQRNLKQDVELMSQLLEEEDAS